MTKYRIVAYPEEGLKKQERIIEARSLFEAKAKGWELFPEYHEIGAFEVKEDIFYVDM